MNSSFKINDLVSCTYTYITGRPLGNHISFFNNSVLELIALYAPVNFWKLAMRIELTQL